MRLWYKVGMSNAEPFRRTMSLLARAAAGLLGAVCLWNVLRLLWASGDLNLWWIDLRFLPPWLRTGTALPTGALLLAWAIRPHTGRRPRMASQLACIVCATICLVNAGTFYWLLTKGEVRSAMPLPVSLLVAAVLGAIAWAIARPPQNQPRLVSVAAVAVVLAGAVPFLHMLSFGLTDYRRQADATIVFGAGVNEDGTLSEALQHRMATGVELYRQGWVRKLIVSGGPGMGSVHETQAMRRYALVNGVPAEDIIVDPDGLCTRDTINNARTLFRENGITSALTVSHFYHLPRIKLTGQQTGLSVYTVPAPQRRRLKRLPVYMAREAAALWVYYLGA
jgi:vancomycin permeability regulator SanA